MMRLLLAAGADPQLVTDDQRHSGDGGVGPQSRHRRKLDHRTRRRSRPSSSCWIWASSAGGVTTNDENALFGPGYRGWNTLLELLIDKGADVNVVSKAGVTPWLAASGYGDRLGGVLYNKEGADLCSSTAPNPRAWTSV